MFLFSELAVLCSGICFPVLLHLSWYCFFLDSLLRMETVFTQFTVYINIPLFLYLFYQLNFNITENSCPRRYKLWMISFFIQGLIESYMSRPFVLPAPNSLLPVSTVLSNAIMILPNPNQDSTLTDPPQIRP